jgi:hypothetical protein
MPVPSSEALERALSLTEVQAGGNPSFASIARKRPGGDVLSHFRRSAT